MFVLMEIDDCFAAMHIHYFQHNDQNLRAKNNMVYRITGLYPFDVKLQDNIIIYNELIDTMRAIMNIFKSKKEKKEKMQLQKKKGSKMNEKKSVHDELGI